MLVKNLVNTLEKLNKPQSFIRLHGPEGKEISRLDIEKEVVLRGEYDVCGMTAQWLINTLKKANPEQRIYLDSKYSEEALFVVLLSVPKNTVISFVWKQNQTMIWVPNLKKDSRTLSKTILTRQIFTQIF